MITSYIVRALVLVVAGGTVGCEQKKESAPAPSPVATEQPQTASPAAPAAAADVTTSVVQALSAYERIRALLAGDQTAGVDAAAADVARTARQAASKSSGEQKAPLDTLARAADALQAKSGASIDEIRKAFGELSRAVVALLVASPELRKGHHIFECPMAEGYKKWVQLKEPIENPYMGKKMLECGSKSEWSA
jgi:Cu(I)/Ag(I) efflux system membrane fusion protein